MTKFLLKWYVPDPDCPDDPEVRSRVGRLSGSIGIGANLLLFAIKLLAGILSGSVSITADALNNLSDASGSILTLVGFRLAGKPADVHHPYGHARFEYLSGLAVAAMIIVGTVIAYPLYVQGVSDVGPVKASMLASVEPVSAAVISAVVLLDSAYSSISSGVR